MPKKAHHFASGARHKAGSIPAKQAGSRYEALSKRKKKGENVKDKQAYVRLSKRTTNILLGYEDLSDWDEEELLRGQKRDKNGGFRGRRPQLIPTKVYDELNKKTLKTAREALRQSLLPGLAYLRDMIEDPEVNDNVRLKSIEMIMNYVMGKPETRIDMTVESKPWEGALEAAIVSVDDEGKVVDGNNDLEERSDDAD